MDDFCLLSQAFNRLATSRPAPGFRRVLQLDGMPPGKTRGQQTPLRPRISSGPVRLKLLVKFASRAGDIHAPWHPAFAVFHPLHNARRFAALRAIRALRGIHYLLAICCFGNLGHDEFPFCLWTLCTAAAIDPPHLALQEPIARPVSDACPFRFVYRIPSSADALGRKGRRKRISNSLLNFT